jgi:cell division protein FtsB
MRSGSIRFLRIPLIILCVIVGVGAWLWFGEGGFVRLYRTESERRACIERIKRLAQENQRLLNEVRRLRTDMGYVESVARKQLDLVKEDEVIYRFESAKEHTGSKTSPSASSTPLE